MKWRKNRGWFRLFWIGFLLALLFGSRFSPPQRGVGAVGGESAGAVFLVENLGQFHPQARYLLQSAGDLTWFAQDAIWISVIDETKYASMGHDPGLAPQFFQGSHIKLSFRGASPGVLLEPYNPQATRISYLTGSDPGVWHPDVPAWGGLRYVDLYPGVDLVIQPQGEGGPQSTWFFEVAPGADLSAVRLRLEGAREVTRMDDQLRLLTETGSITLSLPSLIPSGRLDTASPDTLSQASKVIHIASQTFEVTAPFARSLVPANRSAQSISEGLWYSTYLGGSDWDDAYGLAVDAYGAAYITGRTPSIDFPFTPGAFQTTSSGVDIFVAKLNQDGSGLEYATYVGGSGQDSAFGIAVEDGIAYVVGDTWSADFPLTGETAGENDAFIFALNDTGAELLYATLLGGEDQDYGNAISVEAGEAYFTGSTLSPDFPAPGYKRLSDAFVARLDPDGAVSYATLLGGIEDEAGFGIDVWNGEAFVTGQTWSLDFPAPGFQGNGDAFIARFDPHGELLFSSLLGGIGEERGTAIVVDEDGDSYITGSTNSPDFPLSSGSMRGGRDAFLAGFNDSGELQSAAVFGGSKDDTGSGIALGGSGSVYIAGRTDSGNLPVTSGAYQRLLGGGFDAFLAQFNLGETYQNTGTTYLGGSENDQANALALDSSGNVYLAGSSGSNDFPVTDNAFSSTLSGSQDAFISRFGTNLLPSPPPTSTPEPPLPTLSPTATPEGLLPTSPVFTQVTPHTPQVTDTQAPQETPAPGETQPPTATISPSGDETEPAPVEEATPTVGEPGSGNQISLTQTNSKTGLQVEDPETQASANYLWIILPLGLLLAVGAWLAFRRNSHR